MHERIVSTLRGGPLDLAELRTAVNNGTDPKHPWSEEWLSVQLEILMWRGYVERRGTSYRVVEKETEQEHVDT